MGPLGSILSILGLRFGSLAIHFGVFLRLGPGPGLQAWSSLVTFREKVRNRYKDGQREGAGMYAGSLEFRVVKRNEQVRFVCAGASGLRFRPLIVSLCASIFKVVFSIFFHVFGLPWEPLSQGGPPWGKCRKVGDRQVCKGAWQV